MKNYHEKPKPKERSVSDAMKHAENLRETLPKTIQVWGSDWDLVILADEIKRLELRLVAARRMNERRP